MKKLFNYLVILVAIFTTTIVFGQDEIPVESTFPSFWKFAIGFAVATFSGVFLDSIKHIFAGTFDFGMFWKDSLKPLLFAFGLGLVASAVQVFVPNFSFLIEMVAGQGITLDYETIGLIGSALSLFIKQIMKVPITRARLVK